MPDSNGLVVARTSFFSGTLLVRGGDVWAEDDPIVKHYRQAFRPLEVHRSPIAKPAPPRAPLRRPAKR